MDFGLTLPQGAGRDLRRDVIKVATQAEASGFAGLWAYERRLWPLDPADGLYGVDGLAWDRYYAHCAEPQPAFSCTRSQPRTAAQNRAEMSASGQSTTMFISWPTGVSTSMIVVSLRLVRRFPGPLSGPSPSSVVPVEVSFSGGATVD